MRAKKARKRLARVETVLADIIDQYADPPPGLRDLIATAQSALAKATRKLTAAKKPPARASGPRPTNAVRKGPARLRRTGKTLRKTA